MPANYGAALEMVVIGFTLQSGPQQSRVLHDVMGNKRNTDSV